MSTKKAVWNLKGIFVDQWSPPPNWISAIQWFVQPWEQSAKSERLDHQIFAQLSIDCATVHWVGVCHRLLMLSCWSLRVSAQRQSAFLKTCATWDDIKCIYLFEQMWQSWKAQTLHSKTDKPCNEAVRWNMFEHYIMLYFWMTFNKSSLILRLDLSQS